MKLVSKPFQGLLLFGSADSLRSTMSVEELFPYPKRVEMVCVEGFLRF